jgi:hypothetical protein
MNDFVRVLTTSTATATAIMITDTTGIMITKRLPAGRRMRD